MGTSLGCLVAVEMSRCALSKLRVFTLRAKPSLSVYLYIMPKEMLNHQNYLTKKFKNNVCYSILFSADIQAVSLYL